jgi:hypothetical protein
MSFVVDQVGMFLSCKECSYSVYHSKMFRADTQVTCIPPQLRPQVCVWCAQLDIPDRLPVHPLFDMFLWDMVHTFLLLLTVFQNHIHHDIPANGESVYINVTVVCHKERHI